MASEKLVEALAAIADRLLALASENGDLRADLRRLAQAILDTTESCEQQIEISAGTPAAVPGTELAAASVGGERTAGVLWGTEVSEAAPASPAAALPELTLGQKTASTEPAGITLPSRWAAPKTDLQLIETRCRLKAEGARWAATRRRLLTEGASFPTEIEPKDRDIIARAKAVVDCFLWMCHPSGPNPADPGLYDHVAGSFEAVADVLAIIRQIDDQPDVHQDEFEQSLDLLAEAQSALRVAIARIDGPSDFDQVQVFNWLKTTASECQIFIRRHMRANDPADPTEYADILSRIEGLDARLQESRRRARHRKKVLGKIRHKVSLITNSPQDAEEHWGILIAAVDELVSEGLPPSNRELREMLVPAVDRLPELAEMPKSFEMVLREIDRYLATVPPPETVLAPQPTAEVQEVARLLKGRTMVLIGGDHRPGASAALKDAFGLQDLVWIETREHQSIDGFEPYVARPDVAVVLLAIRWSSHSFADVKAFCDRHGKPLVRLPSGYNPNQVAAQIMAQCSERLKQA